MPAVRVRLLWLTRSWGCQHEVTVMLKDSISESCQQLGDNDATGGEQEPADPLGDTFKRRRALNAVPPNFHSRKNQICDGITYVLRKVAELPLKYAKLFVIRNACELGIYVRYRLLQLANSSIHPRNLSDFLEFKDHTKVLGVYRNVLISAPVVNLLRDVLY